MEKIVFYEFPTIYLKIYIYNCILCHYSCITINDFNNCIFIVCVWTGLLKLYSLTYNRLISRYLNLSQNARYKFYLFM